MISRISGTLESISGSTAALAPAQTPWVVLEVLLPAYAARRLIDRVGQAVTLHTHVLLESPNQGASFVPRLIGFLSPQERAFFDLFTTVKGIGNRKALRALAEPVATIAAAAHRGDARALSQLPEIGKRLAETIIVELKGKLDPYLGARADVGPRPGVAPAGDTSEPSLSEPEQEAVGVLVRLGEQRSEAGRKVARAVERGRARGSAPATVDAIVAAVFAG